MTFRPFEDASYNRRVTEPTGFARERTHRATAASLIHTQRALIGLKAQQGVRARLFPKEATSSAQSRTRPLPHRVHSAMAKNKDI